MGWTFQGGLAGTSGGRLFGFGVDQVLMLEMVLPNGRHVKFGPTEWIAAEGYDVPKTLKVTGVCRTNPDEKIEEKWKWETCPVDVSMNFDDLWFAVRGGGGGTWGIVTSVYVQLHHYLPLEILFLKDNICTNDEDPLIAQYADRVLSSFIIQYFFDPQSMNATDTEGNSCSSPGGAVGYWCYGKDSAVGMFAAWKKYLTRLRGDLINQGYPESTVNKMLSCEATIYPVPSIADFFVFPPGHPYAGQIKDQPAPNYNSDQSAIANIILPKKFILEHYEDLTGLGLGYMAFGGRNKATSDQANSLSEAHREGGYMIFLPHEIVANPDLFPFYNLIFPSAYDTSSGSSFPGFIGSNHVGTNTLGPLKSDWTKPCPNDWTQKERDEKCECISYRMVLIFTSNIVSF